MSNAPPASSDRDRQAAVDADLRTAISALIRAARRRLEQHPQRHLARGGRSPSVALNLDLPLEADADDPAVRQLLVDVARSLDDEVAALLAEGAAFVPGRVWCLRCASAECEHSAPGGPRQVFAGYGPTGLPRFRDLAEWLLERQDPRAGQLYAGAAVDNGERHRGLVTLVTSGRELGADLLDAYRTPLRGPEVELLGQVAAGWFRLRPRQGAGRELALSFQIVASTYPRRNDNPRRRGDASPARARRLSLNVVGAAPDGAPLSTLEERLEAPPWQTIGPWTQSVLESVERDQTRLTADQLSARIEGVLTAIARRLEQGRRGAERRTRHAEDRHQAGERPTRMALADLAQAKDEQILRDALRSTLVVLGDRGRAHVFTPAGKLVTSLRSTPEATARKVTRRRWTPASAEEIATLRARHPPT